MQNNTPNVEELSLNLSNESTSRKEADNSLKVLISNEKAERTENDATNRIKIANESVSRAEADSSITVKLAKEVVDRATENSKLEARLAKLEAQLTEKVVDKVKVESLFITQEMYVRQLNMLKRSAKFILENAKINEIQKDKEESKSFLRHLNNLQLTFDNLIANKNKYQLTEETNKCISEVNTLKEQLNNLATDNWVVEDLFVDMQSSGGGGS